MEQARYWEANLSSANKEIFRILCDLSFYYPILNGPPIIPTLTQISPVKCLNNKYS